MSETRWSVGTGVFKAFMEEEVVSFIKGIPAIDWVINATFNNFSVILWLSVLLVDETGVPG